MKKIFFLAPICKILNFKKLFFFLPVFFLVDVKLAHAVIFKQQDNNQIIYTDQSNEKTISTVLPELEGFSSAASDKTFLAQKTTMNKKIGQAQPELKLEGVTDQQVIPFGMPIKLRIEKKNIDSTSADLFLLLDGAQTPLTKDNFQLDHLVRGAHTIQILLSDKNHHTLTTKALVFYIYQPSRLFNEK